MKNLQRALVAMGCMFSMAAVALPVQAAGASEGGGPAAGVYAVCNCPNKYMEGELTHYESMDGNSHKVYYTRAYTCDIHGCSSERGMRIEPHAYEIETDLGHVWQDAHRYKVKCLACGTITEKMISCPFYTCGFHSVP